MRFLVLFTIVLLAASCRTRNPEASEGLLDSSSDDAPSEPGAASEKVLDGGRFLISCQESTQAKQSDRYEFLVNGANDPQQENQKLLVTVNIVPAGKAPVPYTVDAPGKGAISAKTGVFLGFVKGALTAETPDLQAPGMFTGMLTLAGDGSPHSLPVSCGFKAVTGN